MAGKSNWDRPVRTPAFNIPVVVIVLVAICVVLYGAQYVLPKLRYYSLLPYLVFAPSYSFSSGDPLTAFSVLGYSFMHGSWMHLLVNMAWLVVFGSPLANRIGSLRFLIFWVVSAIVAVLPYVFFMDETVSVVGASGVISALMGAAGRYGFQRLSNYSGGGHPRFAGPVMSIYHALRSERVVMLIGFWIVTDVITGFAGDAAIAWEAHIAGLIFGFLAIRFFDPRPNEIR